MAAAHFGLFAEVFPDDRQRKAVSAFAPGRGVEDIQLAENARRANGDQIGSSRPGALAVGSESAGEKGLLVYRSVIPRPHEAMWRQMVEG